jgi:oxidase EvaA
MPDKISNRMNILNWINKYRETHKTEIKQVNLGDLKDWHFENGIIKRQDSAFFTICGIESDNYPSENNELPIIDQPEIGILGFIVTKGENGMQILLHAKTEPGNVGVTQVGPSVQATESNYKVKHGGKKTNYLDLFLDDSHPKSISIKQSEQGTRFLNKYNLNAVVEVKESEIDINEKKYKWFYLDEVIKELNTDFLFNTDFKSVISNLLENRIIKEGGGRHSPLLNSYFNNIGANCDDIIKSVEKKRVELKFDIKQIPLNELKGWQIDDTGVIPKKDNSFGIGYFNVSIGDREVAKWGQPLVTKTNEEHIILLAIKINDEYRFIFKERMELGFKNYMQLGPTFQYENEIDLKNYELLARWKQSEEGGRFYQNISDYKICLTGDINSLKKSDGLHIMNLHQICSLLKIQGIFTNEARSLIAGLLTLI